MIDLVKPTDTHINKIIGTKYDSLDSIRNLLPIKPSKPILDVDYKEDMCTTAQRKARTLTLIKFNTDDENNACMTCPFFKICNRIVWNKVWDGKGKVTFMGGHLRVTGCDLHPDQKKFKGQSTTTELTDTTLSKRLYYYDPVYNTSWATATAEHSSQLTLTVGQTYTGSSYNLFRTYLLFDTSALSGTVTAAKFVLYMLLDNSVTNFYHNVEDGQPTYPSNPVVTSDYNKSLYSGTYMNVDCTTLSTGSYQDLDFNDVSTVVMGSITKHDLRSNREIAGTVPTGLEWQAFEGPTHVGGNDPKISITYDAPGAGIEILRRRIEGY